MIDDGNARLILVFCGIGIALIYAHAWSETARTLWRTTLERVPPWPVQGISIVLTLIILKVAGRVVHDLTLFPPLVSSRRWYVPIGVILLVLLVVTSAVDQAWRAIVEKREDT